MLSKSAVKTSNGCAFALWQRDRDPVKDKYAYVFYDGPPLPALVKIGKNVIELEKVDSGFLNSTAMDKLQLFRDSASSLSVLLELTKLELSKNPSKVEEAHGEESYQPTDQAVLNKLVKNGERKTAFIKAFEAGDELTETTFTAKEGVGANVGEGRFICLNARVVQMRPLASRATTHRSPTEQETLR